MSRLNMSATELLERIKEEGVMCDECGCEHDEENNLMTIKGE